MRVLSIIALIFFATPSVAAAAGLGDCQAPAHLKLDQLRVDIRGARSERSGHAAGRLVPIAAPLPTGLLACQGQLNTDGICRIGDIVIVEVGATLRRAGRCERDPKETEAYALTGQTFDTALERVLGLPDFVDRYQTLVFWSSFKQTANPQVPIGGTQGCPLAYHSELPHPDPANPGSIMNIKGIGEPYNPAPDQTLHALINMWSIADWTDDELADRDNVAPLNILTHETQHDVCCFIAYREPLTGTFSKRLIGHQGAHWSLYHNTYGQLMYGANWREEGNGTFFSIPPARGTRPLDLYLWGLIPSSAVPPVFVIDTEAEHCTASEQTRRSIEADCGAMQLDGATTCADDLNRCLSRFDTCLEPPYYRTAGGSCAPFDDAVVQSPSSLRAKGRKLKVSIDQILAANDGERVPDYKDSTKVNTQLFVLLVERSGALTQPVLDRLDGLRRAFSQHLYRTTGHRLRNRNTWDGRVDAPLWAWGGASEWRDDDELEGWRGVELDGPLALDDKGGVSLKLKGATSRIVHDQLRLEGAHYDALQVVMRVPRLEGKKGKPRLLAGKLVLERDDGERDEVALPVPADGQTHEITVHPPHAALTGHEKASCAGCTAVCRDVGETGEGWYDSCSPPGAPRLLKTGRCQTTAGLTECGPYCAGQGGESEGWVDSCTSLLDGSYTSLTVIPVADKAAAELSGPVRIERVALFVTADEVTDERRRKQGEKDDDDDGLINAFDNCPTVKNPLQSDANVDDKGDACDDFDADGVLNALDNCPAAVNSLQQDADADGLGDACDPDHEADGACTIGGAPALGGWLIVLLALAIVRRRWTPRQ